MCKFRRLFRSGDAARYFSPFLWLVTVGLIGTAISDGNRANLRLGIVSAQEADEIRGRAGVCYWSSARECPNGVGCGGAGCGQGQGPFFCPQSGAELVNNPAPDPLALFPPPPPTTFDQCDNTTTGLTECGFSTTVQCGTMETCADGCTPGLNLGSAFGNHDAYCKTASGGPNNQESTSASGDLCL